MHDIGVTAEELQNSKIIKNKLKDSHIDNFTCVILGSPLG